MSSSLTCSLSVSLVGAVTATLMAVTTPAHAQAQAAAAPASAASQPAGPTVRPELAVPLGAAQQLLDQGKATEAMAKVDDAARIPAQTPYERYVVERVRAAAAQRLGDVPAMTKALEAALDTGQAPVAEELALLEPMVGTAARQGNHADVLRWSKRYLDLNGTNDAVRLVRIQSQLASGDAAGAKTALLARMEAAGKAGQTLPEAQLRLLLGAQQRTDDQAGMARTLEHVAVNYPRPAYWHDLLVAAMRETQLSDRALLDLLRLLRVTGNLADAGLREDMAAMALRFGQPGEALVLVEEGFAAGQFGAGPKAAEHQKLRDQLRRQSATDRNDRPAAEAAAQRAKDGNALVDLGWAIVASEPAGAAPAAIERGLALIEQGIAKGGLRRPAEARLHLAVAQIAAGRKADARQTLAAIAGATAGEGLASAVHLWSLYAQAPAMLPPRN